jgi:hypothetical protein
VNWLTERIADFGEFARTLPIEQLPGPEGGLRRMPVRQAFDAVQLGVAEGAAWAADQSYLLLEHEAAAGRRLRELATEPLMSSDADTPPSDFTIGLGVGAGTVMYLPDDDRDESDVQAFTEIEGRTGRIRLHGDLPEGFGGIVTEGSTDPTTHCFDGACGDTEPRCLGCNDCRCYTFSEHAEKVRRRFRERSIPWLVIRCYCKSHHSR